MQQIIPALIKAKKNFKKISKDAINPYFKSKYATLDSVLDATESALAEQGFHKNYSNLPSATGFPPRYCPAFQQNDYDSTPSRPTNNPA